MYSELSKHRTVHSSGILTVELRALLVEAAARLLLLLDCEQALLLSVSPHFEFQL